MSESDEDQVGYGKPPKQHRFKPGRSGNPKGRPPKPKPAPLDVGGLLDGTADILVGDKSVEMPAKEAEIRRYVEKAVRNKDVTAMIFLLEQFAKYDAMPVPEVKQGGGVFQVPSSTPFQMGCMLFNRYGPPPWSDAQKIEVRTEYLQTRSELDADYDRVFRYSDLEL